MRWQNFRSRSTPILARIARDDQSAILRAAAETLGQRYDRMREVADVRENIGAKSGKRDLLAKR